MTPLARAYKRGQGSTTHRQLPPYYLTPQHQGSKLYDADKKTIPNMLEQYIKTPLSTTLVSHRSHMYTRLLFTSFTFPSHLRVLIEYLPYLLLELPPFYKSDSGSQQIEDTSRPPLLRCTPYSLSREEFRQHLPSSTRVVSCIHTLLQAGAIR